MTDKEFNKLIEDLSKNYNGDGRVLANAIGSLALGRLYGWRVISIMESEGTIRKYQKILGVRFKDILPERGVYSHRSLGLSIVDKAGDFWAIVQGRGSVKIPRNEKVLLQ